ncbi:MAG: PAS domain S-box protein [Clostridiales bacterium]|jgi:PAS domain S-box-containing protein|nr:PAS domain S-box protein [Clostridiales bacterium]
MAGYLDFRDARCKDCYKCLRGCPAKAIEVVGRHAKIIEKRCVLCGKCTRLCPQNAKAVHSELEKAERLLAAPAGVIASVAPSFVTSFGVRDFALMRLALGKIGFADAEETAVGARAVTEEYRRLLVSGGYRNFITSSCPAVNTMIQLYYPAALEFLAPVDSPMTAHAKLLRVRYPDAKIIFIGPCIAKKKEAEEGGIIDCVLTFEELNEMLAKKGVVPSDIARIKADGDTEENPARFYPISRGIIKSFKEYPSGYEYVAVDGIERCNEVLKNIGSLSGMFLELNSCEYACVNGPCALSAPGGAVKANEDIRIYAKKNEGGGAVKLPGGNPTLLCARKRLRPNEYVPTEREIREILARTGKRVESDELNCGACGYNTCREKAWAVANGYAVTEMCVPYMRERAESMSYEIIQNSPNGIMLLDGDFHITEINAKAMELFGIDEKSVRGRDAGDFFNPSDFVIAYDKGENVYKKKLYVHKTARHVELTIVILSAHKVLFGVMKDITAEENYNVRLNSVKLETFAITDEVIKKQMRVAQEIASLLGETTAETKVALLKLKKTIGKDGAD